MEEIAGLVWRGRFEDPLQDNYYLESLIKSSLIIQEEGEGEEEEEEGNRRLNYPKNSAAFLPFQFISDLTSCQHLLCFMLFMKE